MTLDDDMRAAVAERLAARLEANRARRDGRRRRLAELHERRAYGLQRRHATKLTRTNQEENAMSETTTRTCTGHQGARPPAYLYERTAVGRIPAPEGWTLHFPDPDTGVCDIVPIAGWTVYDNGDAAPYIVDRTGPGCIISDANEGNCYAVAPQESDG